MTYFGIDVHSKYSEICGVSEHGKVTHREQIPTTEASVRRFFAKHRSKQVVFESGPVGPWLARLLNELGHEVTVVNPRRLRLIAESNLKTDQVDAEVLARVSRLDLELLRPVYQRSESAEELRSHLRIRWTLVKTRVALVNSIKGILRHRGYRMRSTGGDRFLDAFFKLSLPEGLILLVDPMIETLAKLNEQLARIDEELLETCAASPLARRLQTVPGVGPIVSLTFIAWMDDPKRFAKSRDVGPCLGFRPLLRSSAGVEYRGRISREGDAQMRHLLVQAAHALQRCRKRSALKDWSDQVIERVGKKKGIVATARKLAVLLHTVWTREVDFQSYPA